METLSERMTARWAGEGGGDHRRSVGRERRPAAEGSSGVLHYDRIVWTFWDIPVWLRAPFSRVPSALRGSVCECIM